MVIKSTKFTPEVLLSAPRRGAAVPNHDGRLAIYTVSSYSFETKEETKEIRILDINTGNSTLFSNDSKAHDARWLGDGTNAIIWLQSGANGITSIMIGDGDKPAEASYTSDVILAPFGDLKTAHLEDGSIAVAMSGLATEEGSLYNKETAEKPPSTGRLYGKTLVRYWDSYMIKQRNVIWYSKLQKNSDEMYSLVAPVHNALKGTKFECPFPDAVGDTGGAFDIGPTGIIFIALRPDSNPAFEPIMDAYFIPIRTFTEPKVSFHKLNSPLSGGFSTVKLSPNGQMAALIQSIEPESADGRLIFAILEQHIVYEMFKGENGSSVWNLSPSGVEWSRDGQSLYISAEDCGRGCLFSIPAFNETINNFTAWSKALLPQKLSHNGTVTGYYSLDNESQMILVSSNSHVENSLYQIIDAAHPSDAIIVNSSSKNGLKLGLSHNQISEMYFESAGDYCVQAWIVKPSDFDENKKYPLALIIHGGPQSSWPEAWSTRWNPCVWAEQGYVVVAPNITGSTGFGRDFVNGIRNEWGGRPYDDLVNCFEHIFKNMPFVDTDRAIAAGASYGGYMVNWIQGMPLGRKFKAIVCHDGIFDLHAMIASDIVYVGEDFNGSLWPWENWKNVEKYSPSRADRCKNWATPMLIIHSEKDFRCITSDGIAAFHLCQRLGIPSQFLNFPDEGHWVLKHENSLLWHHTVFNFINKYSGITKASETPVSTSFLEEIQSEPAHLVTGAAADLEGLSMLETPPPKALPMNIDEFWKRWDIWNQESDLKLLVARAQGMSWLKICKERLPEATPLLCEHRYDELLRAGRS